MMVNKSNFASRADAMDKRNKQISVLAKELTGECRVVRRSHFDRIGQNGQQVLRLLKPSVKQSKKGRRNR